MSIRIKRLDGPMKGQVYLVRDDVGQNLIDVGSAVLADFDERSVATEPAVETPEKSTAYADMKVKELKAEAEERGLEIEGTGTNGRVTRADLIKALS